MSVSTDLSVQESSELAPPALNSFHTFRQTHPDAGWKLVTVDETGLKIIGLNNLVLFFAEGAQTGEDETLADAALSILMELGVHPGHGGLSLADHVRLYASITYPIRLSL